MGVVWPSVLIKSRERGEKALGEVRREDEGRHVRRGWKNGILGY